MLSLFRRNLFVNLILLLLFGVALVAYFMVFPLADGGVEWALPQYEKFFSFIERDRWLRTGVGLAFVLLQAYLVNEMVTTHRLSRALSTIPAAVFLLYSLWTVEPYIFHPILIANLFFILAIRSLMKIYKRHLPVATIFNCGFFIAMASTFHPSYLIFVFIGIIGLVSLRTPDLREILQLVLGFLAPFFFFGVLLMYSGQLAILGEFFSQSISIPELPSGSLKTLAKPLVALLLILLSIGFNFSIRKKKKFDAIKKIELQYWMLLISVLSLVFTPVHAESQLMMISLPLAIIYGLYLESKDNSILKEFFFFMAIALYGIFMSGIL